MNFTDAVELAAYTKQLFPFTTDPQAALLRDACLPFPDPVYVRGVLKKHALESQRLSLPAIREALATELARRGQTNEQQHRAAERQRDGGAKVQQDGVSRLIADMSDEDLADSIEPALEHASRCGTPKLTADACDFLRKRSPRSSATLQNLIYVWFQARRAS